MSTTDKLAERLRNGAEQLGRYDVPGMRNPLAALLDEAAAALEAEAKPAHAEPVAWGMRDKTTGLILDVICPDEHDSHEGDCTVPLYAAPAAPAAKPLEQKELERICYEHTKLNPNLADDRELVGYITAAMRAAIAASNKGGGGA